MECKVIMSFGKEVTKVSKIYPRGGVVVGFWLCESTLPTTHSHDSVDTFGYVTPWQCLNTSVEEQIDEFANDHS